MVGANRNDSIMPAPTLDHAAGRGLLVEIDPIWLDRTTTPTSLPSGCAHALRTRRWASPLRDEHLAGDDAIFARAPGPRSAPHEFEADATDRRQRGLDEGIRSEEVLHPSDLKALVVTADVGARQRLGAEPRGPGVGLELSGGSGRGDADVEAEGLNLAGQAADMGFGAALGEPVLTEIEWATALFALV